MFQREVILSNTNSNGMLNFHLLGYVDKLHDKTDAYTVHDVRFIRNKRQEHVFEIKYLPRYFT
jgi:hypothetical protein